MSLIKLLEFEHGPEYALKELSEQIIQLTRGTGSDGGVVGLSGGIDSTTVAYLCAHAFNQYNQSHKENPLNLYGVLMPSNANNSKDLEDGLGVANALGIESKVVYIEPLAERLVDQLPEIESEIDRGNLYSELRAVVLSRIAATKNLRIMGTGNKDEDYGLGYFTKRGDGAVDNNIIGNLPKRLVRELALYLGVPEDIVYRVPTAGLWKGQTDEGELGYSYNHAEIIQNGFDIGMTPEEISKATGFDIKVIEDVRKRHKTTEHKRNAPPVGKVSLIRGV